jgi:nucleotide-binding universal stress UspA family protein
MQVSKLLYVADTKVRELSPDVLEGLIRLQHKGVQEILFLSTDPSDQNAEGLPGLSVKTRAVVVENLAPDTILHVAEEEKVSLIVVGIDKEKERSYLKSILKKLIDASPLPLLIVNEKEKPMGQGLFDHIIFATDWSGPSEKALKYLLGFKDSISALEVVHVIHEKLTVRDIRQLTDRLVETRKACLAEGIDAESHIYAGKTWEEIVRASQDYKGTLITLGASTKKTIWQELFTQSSVLGGVSEAVVPVLVVP